MVGEVEIVVETMDGVQDARQRIEEFLLDHVDNEAIMQRLIGMMRLDLQEISDANEWELQKLLMG